MTTAQDKAWTNADRDTLIRLYQAGFEDQRIAEMMGRSVIAIRVSRSRLKLSKVKTAAGQTRRPCMCCQQPFMSEGKHNRLCDPCKDVAADDYGVDHYVRAA